MKPRTQLQSFLDTQNAMSESTASIISVPATQHAVLAVQAGGPEVLQYRPDHVVALPGEQEVLIRNEFCGMNYVDTYFRNGLYPSPKPEVLGREGAGIIVTLGSGVTICSDLAVGDRVAWLGTGGYAQYTAVPVAKLIKLPARVSFQDAAASLLGGLTVLTLTEEAYHVRPGDWALVHAAAGSVGGMLVQVLKSLGAQVVATAGGPEKVAIVNNLGADHVIDYRDDKGPRWPKQVRAITAGAGVDVVYDSVGLDTWEGSLDVVKRKGTIVWFGNASGPVPPLSLQ